MQTIPHSWLEYSHIVLLWWLYDNPNASYIQGFTQHRTGAHIWWKKWSMVQHGDDDDDDDDVDDDGDDGGDDDDGDDDDGDGGGGIDDAE